ncbi:MAG: ABC transporter substrate-binding protein [Elusimicrobia bacterium RIFCSPHIGHO2_02_FULL_57_9]|nr:MAG: ABC transporter substrate-binding protein [Elusimicrobia bacterium RIFCSPHIGHO2_02_FULL_57_9]
MSIFKLLLAAALTTSAAQTKTIKFATLAPEGSTWMKVMNELNAELQEKTGGGLKFKMYPGGISGDEKDVVRKVRIGQLQAAGFTGVGLGEIAPELRILDGPWLFRNHAEVDHVYKAFEKEFNVAIEKSGYVLLGWTELGFVYLFSRIAINGPRDMRKAKMWVWEGDPIAEAAYQALDASPIPLSVVDVMSSLQTGLIDTVYGPPMGVIALQWFTRTKYIYPVPLAHSVGAILISKKFFDGLPQQHGKILTEVGAKHLRRLTELARAENEQAMASLQKQGLVLLRQPSAETLKLYEELGRKARRALSGRLYSAALLQGVEKSLEDLRKNSKESSRR